MSKPITELPPAERIKAWEKNIDILGYCPPSIRKGLAEARKELKKNYQ